ncbi:MAG: cupin [Chloroflexota bacterium]
MRERLAGEGLTASTWSNAPWYRYPEHRHDYDKVLVIARGSIVFHLPELGQDIVLEAGDRLDLPAQTWHGADVQAAGVSVLEAHLAAGSLATAPRHVPGWATSDS